MGTAGTHIMREILSVFGCPRMDKMAHLVFLDEPDGLWCMLGEGVSLTPDERWELASLATRFSVGCLKVLCAWGYRLEDRTWRVAAHGGNVATLRFLQAESAATRCRHVASCAAASGQLPVLKFLHSVNAAWDISTAEEAAEAGEVECLAYLVEHGCPVGVSTCAAAARGGQEECLRYLRSKKCAWDWTTPHMAVNGGHAWCLDFAVEEGCDVWDDTYVKAIREGQDECLAVLLCAEHRPEEPLRLDYWENGNGNFLYCVWMLVCYGVRFDPSELLRAASVGNLYLVRLFHWRGYPLWESAVDVPAESPPPGETWEGWAGSLKLWYIVRGHARLLLPQSDEHLRACWATLRFGSLRGAPLTPRAEALLRERRACAQEVVRCFHAAWVRAGAGRAGARKWGAMSRVPREVLMKIMELAEVEICEALR